MEGVAHEPCRGAQVARCCTPDQQQPLQAGPPEYKGDMWHCQPRATALPEHILLAPGPQVARIWAGAASSQGRV